MADGDVRADGDGHVRDRDHVHDHDGDVRVRDHGRGAHGHVSMVTPVVVVVDTRWRGPSTGGKFSAAYSQRQQGTGEPAQPAGP